MAKAYADIPTDDGARSRAVALLCSGGVLFAIYLLTRPYRAAGDTVEQFASIRWLISHTAAMVGFVGLAWGLVGCARALRGAAGERLAGWAAGSAVAGVALLLPYYGAETFALHVLAGDPVVATGDGEVPVAAAIRLHPLAATLFGLGLIAFTVAAVLGAIAFRRSGGSRYASILFAGAWVLLIPQYFVPPIGRMVIGVVLLVACVVFAVSMARLSGVSESADPVDVRPH